METQIEFRVFKESPLVGMTIEECEKEFSIKIDHIHNPTLTLKSKKPPSPDYAIKPEIYINVSGSNEYVGRLIDEAYKI